MMESATFHQGFQCFAHVKYTGNVYHGVGERGLIQMNYPKSLVKKLSRTEPD